MFASRSLISAVLLTTLIQEPARAAVDPVTVIKVAQTAITLYNTFKPLLSKKDVGKPDETKAALDAIASSQAQNTEQLKTITSLSREILSNSKLIIEQINAMSIELRNIHDDINKLVPEFTATIVGTHLAEAEAEIENYYASLSRAEQNGKANKLDAAYVSNFLAESQRRLEKIRTTMATYVISSTTATVSSCAVHYNRVVALMYTEISIAKLLDSDATMRNQIASSYERFFSDCERTDKVGTLPVSEWVYSMKTRYLGHYIANTDKIGSTGAVPQDIATRFTTVPHDGAAESVRVQLGGTFAIHADDRGQSLATYVTLKKIEGMFKELKESIPNHKELLRIFKA